MGEIIPLDNNKIKEIKKILKKCSFDKLSKTDHYKYSLLEKNTDEKLLKKYYSQFERIEFVCLRKGKKENYDIYYRTDKGQAILYAIDINKNPPVLINAYLIRKNLQRLIKSIVKRYKKYTA